jgi:fibronectin-binding autotransporter adhesin
MKTSPLSRPKFANSSILALAAICLAWTTPGAIAATPQWTGAGDGVSWQDPNNWDTLAVPTAADAVSFLLSPGTLQLGGAATAQSINFLDQVTVGAYGNNSLFSLVGSTSTPNMTIDSGLVIHFNNRLTTTGLTQGLVLGGGGTLYLTNINNFIDGHMTVDGSTLMINPNFTVPHVSGAGTGLNNRSDLNMLAQVQKRSINLTNGGVLKIIGAGANLDGASENIILGNNGGGINVAGGFQQLTLDDHPTASQILDNQIQVLAGATNVSLTKSGNGRLTIGDSGGGPDFNLPLTGTVSGVGGGTGLIINKGVVDFNTIENSTTQVTGAASRFSALSSVAATGASIAQSTVTINNGGMLVMNSGTSSKLDTHVTLNAGGVLGGQGNAHYIGNFQLPDGVTFATTTNVPIFTANGGTILARDSFSTQTQRFIRMRDMLTGAGTVDIIGETNNASAPRIVFERGDLQAHNAGFTGTWRLLENTTLESNPRNQTTGTLANGKPIGNGTIELNGFNSGLDLREANAAVTNFTAYNSNTVSLTSTTPGGVNRLAVSGSVSNNTSFHLGNITFAGNQYLQLTTPPAATAGGTNLVRTQNLNFAANSSPTIDTWSTSLRVDNAVNAPTVNLTKLGGTTLANLVDLHFADAVTLNNLNIRAGNVVLTGATGALNLTTGNMVTINSGAPGGLAQGGLVLDNNNTFYNGTTAATNADRLPGTLGIEMRGGLLQLRSQSGTSVSETVGDVLVSAGYATADATRAGAETATLTLGAGSAVATQAVVNFTGTTLGGTAGQIFLGSVGAANVPFLGAQYIVNGNDFASNGTNGIRTPVAGTDNIQEAAGAWASFATTVNMKVITTAMVAMPSDMVANSLNVQVAGTLNTNGFTLTLESGGLLLNAHTISGTAAGGITAGATSSPANLYLTNAGAVPLNARITDNLNGGAVTLVKSGPGQLTLGHQAGVSYSQQGVLTGTPHTNTNTGGFVINSGSLQVQHPNYLGTASATNTITLAGGQLLLDMLQSTSNSQFALGHDVIVNANSRLLLDNNAATANGMKVNNQFNLGKLTINGGNILSYSAFDAYDARFNGGADFSAGSMLESIASDANSHYIINGAITGTAPTFIADRAGGNNPNSTINQGSWGSITYGGGPSDTTATALTGDTLLEGGTLRLDKANGTNAIGSGNITINGGSLYFGPGQNAQTWGAVGVTGQMMTFNGFGLVTGMNDVSMSASGQNQIPDTATITLLGGNLGENNRVNNDRIGTLNMRNGQFSPGLGTFSIGTANIAGGNVAFNTGSTLQVDNLNLQSGAPNISIAIGNTAAVATVLDVTNISMTGQSIFTGQGGTVTNGMGKMILRGNLTSTFDALNAGSYTIGIFQQTGNGFRTLSQNSTLDLAGGARSFDISEQQMFSISSKITNGSIIKDGKGWLGLESFVKNDFNDLTVNQGTVFARGMNGLGQSASTTLNTVNVGGTLRLEDLGVVTNENFLIKGAGAEIPGSRDTAGLNPIFEEGALVNEKGANTITGTFAISNDAVISSRSIQAGGLTQPGNGWILASNSAGYLAIDSTAGITGTGSLTLTGNANGRLLMGLNTGATGSLIKSGGGDWSINGASNYVGTTEISAGSLTISDGGALGTAVGATTVNGGSSLRLMNNISTAENLNLAGAGTNDASGALVNLSGANTVTGTLNLKFPTTIQNRAGTLNLTSTISGGNALIVSGAGNTNISSGLVALGSSSLTKNGTGTLALSNASASMSALNANGGVTAMSTALAINASPVNLGGGSVRADASTVLVGGLNVNAGGGKVMTAGGNFSLGAITRTAGGSVDFSGAGTIATTSAAGILSYSTFGGTAHANIAGGNVVAFAGYAAANNGVAIASGDKETSFGINVNSNSGITANTLRLGANSSGIALGSGTFALTTNTLIANNTGNAGITGTGNINSTGDLMVAVSQASGGLDISAPLNIATGSHLVKSGAGTLTLSNNANVIPGNIYVNEGTLAINGPGGSGHPGVLGALTGLRTIALNGGALSIPYGDYDPSPAGINNMTVAIGAAGGTLNVGSGNLLFNDVGQFSAAGDITKVGGGRLQIGFVNNTNINGTIVPDNVPPYTPPYPVRGNVNVNEGILEMVGSAGGLGSVKENVITVNAAGTLVTGASAGSISSRPFANDVVVNSGGQIFSRNADTRFDGQVTLSGNTTVNLMELDTHHQNRSIWLAGRVVQTGVTNVVGTNNGSALFLVGSANDISGTFNLGTNATLEARGQGTLGDGSVNPIINLNGANSRLLLRSEQNSDFYANVNVNNTGELGADRPNAGSIGGNQILSINNLNINGPADRAYVTTSGGNTYAIRVNGAASISNSPRLNIASSDLVLSQGATVSGNLLKHGGTSIVSEGNLAISGSAIINNGGVYLRGANGAITGATSVALRGTGAVLTLDNGDNTPNTNRLADTTNLILGGGTLRVAGQESVLAASVTAAAGQTAIGFSPASVSAYSPGTVDPLTLTGFTRTKGAALNFTNDVFGTPGNLSSGQLINNANNVNTGLGGAVQVSPRILIPGQASVTQAAAQDANGLVNSVIPWAVGQNNEFVQYDSTTMDAGAPRGIYYLLNGNYTNNVQTAGIVNRWTGAQGIAANLSVPAIKFDGAVTHTINAGINLTVTQGAMIFVAATTVSGGTITTGPTGADEMFFTINGNTVLTSAIAEGPVGTAFIKNGAATLNLNADGNNYTAAPSTYTGGFFHNAGVTESRAQNKIPSANLITMAGGTLSFNPEWSNTGAAVTAPAANSTYAFGNDVRFVGSSLFRADNGLNAGTAIAAGTGNFQLQFGKLTVEPGIHAQLSGFDSTDFQFLNGAQIGQTGGPAPIIDVADAGGGGSHTTRITGNLNAPAGFIFQTSNLGNGAIFELGGGTGDTVANTISGPITVMSGTLQSNKAAGTAAITSDIIVNGGTVTQLQDNQLADTVNVELNGGTFGFGAKNETIASFTQNGGLMTTGGGGIQTITGNYIQRGISGSADGLQVNSGAVFNIGGNLVVEGFGKVVVGAGAGTRLNVAGDVTLTGTALQINTGGSGVVGITGSVNTLASAIPSYLGVGAATAGVGTTGLGDGTIKVDLLNTKAFNIADGVAGDDLIANAVLQNGAGTGGLTKNGAGTMVLSGTVGNTYTGPTTVNAGVLVLNKTAGQTAVPGSLAVNGSSRVVLRQSNQIAATAAVVMAGTAVLDLETGNASQTVGSLTGVSGNKVLLGSGSLLTTGDATAATFAGNIHGAGAITKQGTGKFTLTGDSDYTGATNINNGNLEVGVAGTGSIHGSPVFVNANGILSGTGSVSLERTGSLLADAAVLLNVGGSINPGNSPGILSTGSMYTTGGTVNYEIGGLTPGNGSGFYDQLNVAGAVNLTGTTIANFSVFGGHTPTSTDLYFLLNNDGSDPIVGTFSGIPEGAIVTLGGVNYTATYQADYSSNAVSGGNDFALVPEPTAAVLALLSGLGISLRRRRK